MQEAMPSQQESDGIIEEKERLHSEESDSSVHIESDLRTLPLALPRPSAQVDEKSSLAKAEDKRRNPLPTSITSAAVNRKGSERRESQLTRRDRTSIATVNEKGGGQDEDAHEARDELQHRFLKKMNEEGASNTSKLQIVQDEKRARSRSPPSVHRRHSTSEIAESPKRSFPRLNSVWGSFMDELTASYEPEAVTERQEAVYNFVQVPLRLERLLLFGFFLCFDAFLFLFTFMPIRIGIAIFTLLFRPFSSKTLTSTQTWDLLRACIVIICFYGLTFVDTSRLYHYIRGQAILKLYVIFNVLEIFDKLCCSFGQDIFASLFWKTVDKNSNSNSQLNKRHLHLHPFIIFLVALVYTSIHSLVLFYLTITLNVAMNSHNNALLTLLISNQFVELKGCVFKKFEKENLFQISCSDMVERFQLSIFVLIVTIQNFTDLEWHVSEYWWDHLVQVVTVWLSEIVVDWIKHAFITKFNKIAPEVYKDFKEMLTHDIVKRVTPSRVSFDSHTMATRIGFVPLPLACLVVRMFYQFIKRNMPLDLPYYTTVGLVVSTFSVLCLVKIAIRTQLVRSAMKAMLPLSPWSETKVPNRYAMFKGKIP